MRSSKQLGMKLGEKSGVILCLGPASWSDPLGSLVRPATSLTFALQLTDLIAPGTAEAAAEPQQQ